MGIQSNVAQLNIEASTRRVRFNTFKLADLDKLPGIGQIYGQNMIDHRPYSDINELVSNKIIPQSIFGKIKDNINLLTRVLC